MNLKTTLGSPYGDLTGPTCQGNMALSMAKIFQQIINKAIIHKQGSKDFLSSAHKFILYHLMEETPFDLPRILFNCFVTEVMKDKSIEKDIYHNFVLTKVFEAHGVIRKFLYETPEEVHDKIYFDGVFLLKQKAFNQENISKMKMIDDGFFQQTPQVDDFILFKLHLEFRLNTRRDDHWMQFGRKMLRIVKEWTQTQLLLKLKRELRRKWALLHPKLLLFHGIHLLLSLLLRQQVQWPM